MNKHNEDDLLTNAAMITMIMTLHILIESSHSSLHKVHWAYNHDLTLATGCWFRQGTGCIMRKSSSTSCRSARVFVSQMGDDPRWVYHQFLGKGSLWSLLSDYTNAPQTSPPSFGGCYGYLQVWWVLLANVCCILSLSQSVGVGCCRHHPH